MGVRMKYVLLILLALLLVVSVVAEKDKFTGNIIAVDKNLKIVNTTPENLTEVFKDKLNVSNETVVINETVDEATEDIAIEPEEEVLYSLDGYDFVNFFIEDGSLVIMFDNPLNFQGTVLSGPKKVKKPNKELSLSNIESVDDETIIENVDDELIIESVNDKMFIETAEIANDLVAENSRNIGVRPLPLPKQKKYYDFSRNKNGIFYRQRVTLDCDSSYCSFTMPAELGRGTFRLDVVDNRGRFIIQEEFSTELFYIDKKTHYVHANKKIIAEKHQQWLYRQHDHMGSAALVTNEDKYIVSEAIYSPFGESLLSDPITFGFSEKEADESGLLYFGARYYDNDAGRFTTIDPVKGKSTDPQSLNRYVYVKNNPLTLIDPDGRQWVDLLLWFGADSSDVMNMKQDSYELSAGGVKTVATPEVGSQAWNDQVMVNNNRGRDLFLWSRLTGSSDDLHGTNAMLNHYGGNLRVKTDVEVDVAIKANTGLASYAVGPVGGPVAGAAAKQLDPKAKAVLTFTEDGSEGLVSASGLGESLSFPEQDSNIVDISSGPFGFETNSESASFSFSKGIMMPDAVKMYTQDHVSAEITFKVVFTPEYVYP